MQIRDNKDDLKQTVEKYKNIVYALARSHLKSREDADDVFQEVFLLYYEKTLNFENEHARKAWLIKAVLNLCKKHNQSTWATRVERLSDENDPETNTPLLTDEENDVLQAVMSLKEKLRVPIYLYYFTGLSIDEIARVLNIKSGTVQVRLVRARKVLKEKLKGEYFYE